MSLKLNIQRLAMGDLLEAVNFAGMTHKALKRSREAAKLTEPSEELRQALEASGRLIAELELALAAANDNLAQALEEERRKW